MVRLLTCDSGPLVSAGNCSLLHYPVLPVSSPGERARHSFADGGGGALFPEYSPWLTSLHTSFFQGTPRYPYSLPSRSWPFANPRQWILWQLPISWAGSTSIPTKACPSKRVTVIPTGREETARQVCRCYQRLRAVAPSGCSPVSRLQEDHELQSEGGSTRLALQSCVQHAARAIL